MNGSIPNADEDNPFRARRANVEDLPALQALWQHADLPWDQLDRFVTEFLVVPGTTDGTLLAAIGLQIDGQEALMHSEALLPQEDPESLRQALWQRLQIVARNHGVTRIWTLEDDPFWQGVFSRADLSAVQQLKAAFADPGASWWTFQLVDPAKAQRLIDERIAVWEAARQSDKTELAATIQKFQKFAYVVFGLVLVMMVVMVLYVVVRRPDAFQTLLRGAGAR